MGLPTGYLQAMADVTCKKTTGVAVYIGREHKISWKLGRGDYI